MSLTSLVKARLEAMVPELKGRVQGAADMARMLADGATPTAPISAFVVPMGLLPEQADSMTGVYTQMVGENIGILLVLRSFGQPSDRAEVAIEDLIERVCNGVLGWGPDDAAGVATLVSGEMQPVQPGGLISYLLTIQIKDQLRIFT